MDVNTNLLFTRNRINQTIDLIKKLSEEFDFINKDDIYVEEEDYCSTLGIVLYLSIDGEMNKKLNQKHGLDDYQSLCCDWEQVEQNKRYWKFSRGGRILCGEILYNYALSSQDYNHCPCPTEFKKLCQGLHSILSKHQLKKNIELFN